ncbi:hypothetical protein Cflav_PD5870 [Pedosphaera parvula Ellin514]|uniref:Uncharacterized protein n=1 Tax=Pedosphaera parvula (strain Ellin514) TaxID=320771 RepID=B9X9T4_PEDPL|nr:hypothetical protein Cflav_PD5870 [Pedosphaera parvula Ellin514]
MRLKARGEEKRNSLPHGYDLAFETNGTWQVRRGVGYIADSSFK